MAHTVGYCQTLTLAEGEGFEPPEPLRVLRFSRPSQSTTLAPLRNRDFAQALLLNSFIKNILGNIDGDFDGEGEGDGVAGAAIDFDNFAVMFDPELGEIGMVA